MNTRELLELLPGLLHILPSPERLMEVSVKSCRQQNSSMDRRRTEITENAADINIENPISQENIVVTLSHQGDGAYSH
ncbi:hypothetical protein ACNKHW_14270 [Shigella flexneri]